MTTLAPICFIAFRRPAHVQQSLNALEKARLAQMSDLFCFLDAAQNESDRKKVEAVEQICRERRGFASVRVQRHQNHLGLGSAVVTAIDAVLKHYEHVIVVEEDVIVSPNVLAFLNSALVRFARDHRVMAACGYIFADVRVRMAAQSFFSKRGGCWGWATWRDRWKLLQRDKIRLLDRIEAAHLQSFFKAPAGFSMLDKIRAGIAGTDTSWSPTWYASAALANRLFLYPCVPLIRNIGFDGSGSHSLDTDAYDVELGPDLDLTLPSQTLEHPQAEALFQEFFTATCVRRRAARRARL